MVKKKGRPSERPRQSGASKAGIYGTSQELGRRTSAALETDTDGLATTEGLETFTSGYKAAQRDAQALKEEQSKSEQKLPRGHQISRVLAGGLFALFFGAFIQALTLFGVITMNSGHVFMFVAFIAGALLLTTEILPVKPRKHKILSVAILGVVLLVIDVASALYASRREQIPTPSPLVVTPAPTPDLRSELRADGNRAIRLVTARIMLKRKYSIDEIGHFRVMYEVGTEINKVTPEFYLGSQDYYDINSTIDSRAKQFGFRWTVRYRKPNNAYLPTESFSTPKGYGAVTGLTSTTDTLAFSVDLYNQIPSDKTMEDLFGKYLYIFVTESLADKISEVSFQVNNWQFFSVKADRLVFVDDKPIAPWFIALSNEEQDIHWKSVMVRFEQQLPSTVKGQYVGWTWSLDPGSLHPKKMPEPELKADPFKSN
jgi:hypothetical protein